MSASDDDFGPFVGGPLEIPPSPSPKLPHTQQFLVDAKANTDRNRKAVLDELLTHQDEPLYWHRARHSPPAPPIASTPVVHAQQNTSSSSWFSTLQDKIPSPHNSLPVTRSLFSGHAHTPSFPVTYTSTLPPKASTSSPFTPHIFVPIPGAPGFKPDEYDWDKGFSADLEHEAVAENLSSRSLNSQRRKLEQIPPVLFPEDTAPVTMTRSPNPSPVPVPLKLGEYIEKRGGTVELVGRRLGTTPVLSPDIAEKIRPHLPALSRLSCTWTLVYSLDQHGISLKTLYTNCENASAAKERSATKFHGMLFVVKDADGAIFGAWMGEGLRMSRGSEKYYGGGESFLWKWAEEEKGLKVFRWTGKNDYIALCEPEFISFGGGDGSYGLYLDDTLYEGTSARSITFANDVLCSTSGPRLAGGAIGFECVGVEVWGVCP